MTEPLSWDVASLIVVRATATERDKMRFTVWSPDLLKSIPPTSYFRVLFVPEVLHTGADPTLRRPGFLLSREPDVSASLQFTAPLADVSATLTRHYGL